MLPPQELAEYLQRLKDRLLKAVNKQFYQAIVDEPFKEKFQAVRLDLGIIAFLLLDTDKNMINRIAMSDTELAHSADTVSAKPFHEMNIPSDHKTNIIAAAIQSNTILHTSDWKDLFVPVLKASEARFNQAAGGIGSSIVVPVITSKLSGALVYDFYQPIENIDTVHKDFVEKYSRIVKSLL